MTTYNFMRMRDKQYIIRDEVNYPIGEIYNKNSTIYINIITPMDFDELVNLLNSIDRNRKSYNINIGHGKCIIEMKN